jgi:hypothetical protein
MEMFLILLFAYLIGEIVVRAALGKTTNAEPRIVQPPEATKNRKAA